jgi:hypothetical protein
MMALTLEERDLRGVCLVPELGQVRYHEHDRRWERFDGRAWTTIAPTLAQRDDAVIVYETTPSGE